jgi:hypothetical protein
LSPALSDFPAVLAGLHQGDFTKLDPLFAERPGPKAALSSWIAEGRFSDDPAALNEALTCACFNGRTTWVAYLLDHGADLVAGAGTGLNGFHWATNRGQLDTVQLLLDRGMPLELRNSYGGTVLGGAVWAAVHEPRPAHRAIVAALLASGARVEDASTLQGIGRLTNSWSDTRQHKARASCRRLTTA